MSNKKEQEVIEAIVKVSNEAIYSMDNCYLEVGVTAAKGAVLKLAIPPALREKIVDQVLAITYPSGHPMIAILDDDQTRPDSPFAKEADMGQTEAQARTSGYYCAQQDMANWHKTLGGK